MIFRFLYLLGIACSTSLAAGANRPAAPDFARDIEPILADNCYACHGPDPGGRKAGLRLDRAEFALVALKDGKHAVVPHDAGKSEIIRRLESTDPDEHMPPAPHEKLTAAQVATLKLWIEQGAVYRDHWSFEKPERPALPEVRKSDWPKNPIDRFILARLEAEGLYPSPPVSKTVLLRRATLDLTGLLPTPAEIDAFAADNSPDAYAHVVDRLLASPHYGEHRARYWLDYVRYGDTHGLHNDNYREIWPYRDYVIDAFNRNEPFDQFAVEQIAGDLLPPKAIDQLVATGFIRCNLSTGEGGVINEELRVTNARDRTEAYGTVFLGLTVGCAVCHDHKFDPTKQEDFYRLSAYFNNLTERPFNDDQFAPAPVARIPKPEKAEAFNRVFLERAAALEKLNARKAQPDRLLHEWLASSKGPRAVSEDSLEARFRFDEGKGDVAVNSAPMTNEKSLKFIGAAPVWGEQTMLWPALRFDVTTKLESATLGNYDTKEGFSGGGWLQVEAKANTSGEAILASITSRMDVAHDFRGWDLFYDNGPVTLYLVNTWPNNALRVQTTARIERGEWNHVFFTYDGSGKAAGVHLYINGSEQPTKVLDDKLAGTIQSAARWELGRRYDSAPLKFARYQDVRLYRRALSTDEVARLPWEDNAARFARKPAAQWTQDERNILTTCYFDRADERSIKLKAQLADLDRKLDALSAGGTTTLICKEREQPAYADVLARGVYTARTKRVSPATPGFLPAIADAEPDRLGLARWTVSPENPLTARVTINRMWQEVFGVGLVDTPGNFGLMGDRPSHPELLDWLAVEFRESKWDVKHMYRLMLTSAAYQQSAALTPALLEKDPQNRLLARGPRFRMDGEMLRDSALESAGLLVDHIGGPSVKPYQPAGVWEAVRGLATKPGDWVQDKGAGTYRRSMYTFLKRQAPAPNLQTFNAPDRDVACPRRDRSDTPLQALVLWNDPQWVEAARVLAGRAMDQGRTDPNRILSFMTRRIISRSLEPDEQQIFLESFEEFRKYYATDMNAARALVHTGDASLDMAAAPVDQAAWTIVASELQNSDEALNK